MAFHTVSKPGDIDPGDMAAFDIGGERVAVANVDGDFYAFDDRCTHANCSLSEGDLEGATFGSLLEAEGLEPTPLSVVCPCHVGMFDLVTGAVLGGPPPTPVRVYPVRIHNGELQVEVS